MPRQRRAPALKKLSAVNARGGVPLKKTRQKRKTTGRRPGFTDATYEFAVQTHNFKTKSSIPTRKPGLRARNLAVPHRIAISAFDEMVATGDVGAVRKVRTALRGGTAGHVKQLRAMGHWNIADRAQATLDTFEAAFQAWKIRPGAREARILVVAFNQVYSNVNNLGPADVNTKQGNRTVLNVEPKPTKAQQFASGLTITTTLSSAPAQVQLTPGSDAIAAGGPIPGMRGIAMTPRGQHIWTVSGDTFSLTQFSPRTQGNLAKFPKAPFGS